MHDQRLPGFTAAGGGDGGLAPFAEVPLDNQCGFACTASRRIHARHILALAGWTGHRLHTGRGDRRAWLHQQAGSAFAGGGFARQGRNDGSRGNGQGNG